MKRRLLLFAFVFVAVGLTGCGSGSGSNGSTEVSLKPVGDEMKYEQTTFTVAPGQEVKITFQNTATSLAMSHNVVVLNSTADDVINRVGTKAIEAGEANEYIPEDEAIIAHTPLASPGETVTVTFTAPSTPGEYKYICTFPGHYMMMQGVMVVQG